MKTIMLAAALALAPAIAGAGECPNGAEPDTYIRADGRASVKILPNGKLMFSSNGKSTTYKFFQGGHGWGYAALEKDGHPWWSVDFIPEGVRWDNVLYKPVCR